MKICEDKDYCYVEMPEKDTFIKYHHGVKFVRAPFIMYADIEVLMIRVNHQQPRKISMKCVIIH